MENSTKVPQRIKNRTTICSSNSSSGYISEDNEITTLKRYLHTCPPMFNAFLFTIAKTLKQPKYSLTNGWIKKTNTHNTMKYYSAIKKEILSFATTWINLEGIIKWSKPDTKRQILHETKKPNSQKQRVELLFSGAWGGGDGEVGQTVQSFSYARWAGLGDLMYSRVATVNNNV